MNSVERTAYLIAYAQTMMGHISTMRIIWGSVGEVSSHDMCIYSILYEEVDNYIRLYNSMKCDSTGKVKESAIEEVECVAREWEELYNIMQ